MGYHKAIIPKGRIGGFSKIEEEFLEFKDAVDQGNRVMELVELSDMLGAIKLYLWHNYDNQINITDLLKMTDATMDAFESGERK